MKQTSLTFFTAFLVFAAFSQNDKMTKHNGEKLEVKVLKVGETTITYKYPGEDAEQTIGKYAVANIVYGTSGRKEEISEKIVISGEDDWEKVQILTDKAQVIGLKREKRFVERQRVITALILQARRIRKLQEGSRKQLPRQVRLLFC